MYHDALVGHAEIATSSSTQAGCTTSGCMWSEINFDRPFKASILRFHGTADADFNLFIANVVAQLAEYLTIQHAFSYSGFAGVCKLLASSCFTASPSSAELQQNALHYFDKLITANPTGSFLCSSFPIAVYQTIFILFDPALVVTMPMFVKACRPSHLIEMAKSILNIGRFQNLPILGEDWLTHLDLLINTYSKSCLRF